MSLQTSRGIRSSALAAVIVATLLASLLAAAILQGASYLLIPLAVGAATFVLLQTLKDWRRGVIFFLVWMLFEDLVRKNLGNNMAIYFAKDVLLAACCLSFYVNRGREKILKMRPLFLFPLTCFFFWGVLQVFNPNSLSFCGGMTPDGSETLFWVRVIVFSWLFTAPE